MGDLVFMKKARQSGEFVVQRMFVQAASNRARSGALSGWRTRWQRRTLSATGGCSTQEHEERHLG